MGESLWDDAESRVVTYRPPDLIPSSICGCNQARNPSDRDTLIELAGEIGADASAFAQTLDLPETHAELQREIEKVLMMDSWRFPSLVLDLEGSRRHVPVDYLSAEAMLDTIASLR